jgi:hypothetical protein
VYFVMDRGNVAKRIDFDQHDRCFALSRYIHGDKRQAYIDRLEGDRAFTADLAASVAAGIMMSGYADWEHFCENQIRLCRDSIIDIGFSEIDERNALELLRTSGGRPRTVAMVAGCQDERMLGRRIARLATFAIDMHKQSASFDLVFSGRCPESQTVRIPNEAIRMESMYKAAVGEVDSKLVDAIRFQRIDGEGRSQNTEQNIEELFKHHLPHKSQNLVVISSTFHLIRIGRKLSACFKDESYQFQSKINHLVLVGAEDLESAKKMRVTDIEYLKLMMFDLYWMHLKALPTRDSTGVRKRQRLRPRVAAGATKV